MLSGSKPAMVAVMLYHVSSDGYLGDEITLTPRVPLDRATGEDDSIPRVAVALSVSDCIAGIHGCGAREYDPELDVMVTEYPDVVAVYRAIDPGAIFDPRGLVPDSHRSGELWLTEPTRFRFMGRVECWMDRAGRYLWRPAVES